MKEKLKTWSSNLSEVMAFLLIISLSMSVLAAWITHIFHTITMEYYAFLVLGIVVPIIGIINGYLIWLGVV